jgi:hypothetical protein
MIILETQLNAGVNMRITKSTQEVWKQWRNKFVTIDAYKLEWQTAGGCDWNVIDSFTTQGGAMRHMKRMIKAAEKLNFTTR